VSSTLVPQSKESGSTGTTFTTEISSPPTNTAAKSTPQTHSSLSTSAIVGISFGAFITVSLFLAGVLFFVYKSWTLRHAAAAQVQRGPEYHKPELDSQASPTTVMRQELPVPVSWNFLSFRTSIAGIRC